MSAAAEYLDAAGVAQRIGVKRKSIYEYLSRGDMPAPDVMFLGKPLWLVSTIDEWRKLKYKRKGRPPRTKQRMRPRPPELEAGRRSPPIVVSGDPSPPVRANKREGRRAPKPSRRGASSLAAPIRSQPVEVTEAEARELAAAIRQQGFHCTSADVVELLGLAVGERLEHERELLRQRIVAKRRERVRTPVSADDSST